MISVITKNGERADIPAFTASYIPTIRDLAAAAARSKARTIVVDEIPDKVIMHAISRFAAYHHAHPMPNINVPLKSSRLEDAVPVWYADFINEFDPETLKRLLETASAINYHPLEVLVCARIAAALVNTPKDQLKAELAKYHYDLNEDEESD